MNEKVLQTLEYHKIIDLLAEKCHTPLGKTEAEELRPYDDLLSAGEAQAETEDALSRLFRFGNVSCSGARDIRDSLLRLKIQANLSISELLNISRLLQAAERVKAYGDKGEEEETENDPPLKPYFVSLAPLQTLRREIDRCIISEEEIADDASSQLRSIRRKLQSASARIHNELNSILLSHSTYLRENVVTIRNGRYCIPVKQEYRSQVSGLVHDESGSGSTVFIEPMAIVRLNNEVRELEIAEQKEIEVILANLSALAADHIPELDNNLKVLSHLDFVFAKASLARDMNAVRPEFNNRHFISLKKARHPLLDKKIVVPIDIMLGDSFHQLIVTGPNTGGKTVSLKTVGLLSLMGQAGLHIPALQGSSLGMFTEIYADIGDEQSIEQSLSTFSSHMKNLIGILDKADGDSLVLMDELCAGTDPSEGAALAIAILNFLHRMEIRTMATTHYSELKLYALSTPGVENASCEFDVATLSPTYRLLIGIPGKSNAFAISEKLGLPGFIIDEAREQLDDDSERFEDVIRNLDDSRRSMELEQQRIEELKKEAKRLRDDLDRQNEKLEAQREKILSAAREEARKVLQEAKDQVDETIRAINRSGSAGVKDLEAVRTKTRELLNKNAAGEQKEQQKSRTKSTDLHIGDGVQVLSMGLKGTVSTLPDKNGNLFVQMGILRSQVNISDVVLLNESTVSVGGKTVGTEKGHAAIGAGKAATISPEINLIGKTVDEALPDLAKYLDDAYLAHLEQVRIVHGRGTGALRNAVHQTLKKTKYIKEFHLGAFGEGDSGVTIAVFK
ncbi:MAG: endonuclease MutS2 [Eubacterium sp.]|nr:endonuclease MutS2 [Eubacterium sp.]